MVGCCVSNDWIDTGKKLVVCACKYDTQYFAGVGVQPEDGHCQWDGEADVVLGVLQGRVLGQYEVDPHGLHVWRGARQLRDQQTLKALGGLKRKQRGDLLCI